MKADSTIDRFENPSTERVWRWLMYTVPFMLAIAFMPILVPGEFVDLGAVSLFIFRLLFLVGIPLFILSAFCGIGVLSTNLSHPQSEWIERFGLWQVRFGLLFLSLSPIWLVTMAWVWAVALL